MVTAEQILEIIAGSGAIKNVEVFDPEKLSSRMVSIPWTCTPSCSLSKSNSASALPTKKPTAWARCPRSSSSSIRAEAVMPQLGKAGMRIAPHAIPGDLRLQPRFNPSWDHPSTAACVLPAKTSALAGKSLNNFSPAKLARASGCHSCSGIQSSTAVPWRLAGHFPSSRFLSLRVSFRSPTTGHWICSWCSQAF